MCFALRSEIEKVFGIPKTNVICGNGSEELIDVIARNFIGSEDEILISEFGYIQFVLAANRLNARLRKATEKYYSTDVDQLLMQIKFSNKINIFGQP